MLSSPASAPAVLDEGLWQRQPGELGWQRWFLALGPEGRAIGHVELAGASLASALHRCRLGIGVERGYRGQGLGRRLMQHAIAFAAAQPSLSWVDLRVFVHNDRARALYRSLGFQELGLVPDQFRVAGASIDDVRMTLALPSPPARQSPEG